MNPVTSEILSQFSRVEGADSSIQVGLEGNSVTVTLVGTHCHSCGVVDLGKRVACANCVSADVDLRVLDPRATLKVSSTVHLPAKTWIGNRPYVLGEAKLNDGPTIVAEILGENSTGVDPDGAMEVAVLAVSTSPDECVLVPKLTVSTGGPGTQLTVYSEPRPAGRAERKKV